MGWLDSAERFAGKAFGEVESAAASVGHVVTEGAEAVEGAGGAALNWMGDHKHALEEGGLGVLGCIPGVNILTEGAQAAYYGVKTAEDGVGALMGDKEAKEELAGDAGKFALHTGATALNLLTGEGGALLSGGEALAKEGTEALVTHGTEALVEQGAKTATEHGAAALVEHSAEAGGEHLAEGAGEHVAEAGGEHAAEAGGEAEAGSVRAQYEALQKSGGEWDAIAKNIPEGGAAHVAAEGAKHEGEAVAEHVAEGGTENGGGGVVHQINEHGEALKKSIQKGLHVTKARQFAEGTEAVEHAEAVEKTADVMMLGQAVNEDAEDRKLKGEGE